ncbi:MAG TPA: arginine--tRNA ligase, partial [Kiloniellales bacterium]
MNFFNAFRDIIVKELENLAGEGRLPAGLDFSRVTVEPPRDPSHGDLATNAAMVLAKAAGCSPRSIAEPLAGALGAVDQVESAEVAGPGFINLRLGAGFWRAQLMDILRAGPAYGDSKLGRGRKVNVEYVSTNPTGPLTVGHARGAVVGDALASLLAKVGYDVTREYYINDAGAQVDSLAWATYWRYLQALGSSVTEDTVEALHPQRKRLEYGGEYLIPVGRALVEKFGDQLAEKVDDDYDGKPIDEWLPTVREFAIDAMMALIRNDLALLGVEQEVFSSERALVASGGVEAVLAELEAQGLIYTGVLEPPKGKRPDDWEPR